MRSFKASTALAQMRTLIAVLLAACTPPAVSVTDGKGGWPVHHESPAGSPAGSAAGSSVGSAAGSSVGSAAGSSAGSQAGSPADLDADYYKDFSYVEPPVKNDDGKPWTRGGTVSRILYHPVTGAKVATVHYELHAQADEQTWNEARVMRATTHCAPLRYERALARHAHSGLHAARSLAPVFLACLRRWLRHTRSTSYRTSRASFTSKSVRSFRAAVSTAVSVLDGL